MLHKHCTGITLCWVSLHMGIQENEQVDIAVYRSATCNWLTVHVCGPSIEKYNLEHFFFFFAFWQACRANDSLGDKFKIIKPLLGDWSTSCSANPHKEVILIRLRIGHTHLTRRYHLTRNFRSTCLFCHSQSLLSVHYILVGCESTHIPDISFSLTYF